MGVTTLVGSGLRGTGLRLYVACGLAIVVAAVDLWFAFEKAPWLDAARAWSILPLLLMFMLLCRGAGVERRQSLGLVFVPEGGWLRWFRIALLLGVLVLGVAGIASLIFWLCGALPEAKSMFQTEEQILPFVLHACVRAPILEEWVYRFALCVPLVAAIPRWPLIVLSGAAFAFLHVGYGNPAPDNAIAGFVLAWAFLRSGSILVPIVFHALGNLFVVLVHTAMFYWL